ncbi:hypothetical protein QL285_027001 [Trifolium repens]|nr:hypothetical protein QL285_027001 [Trifolium repens]
MEIAKNVVLEKRCSGFAGYKVDIIVNTGFKTLVEESQFEVEPSDNGTKGRLSTLTLGYLMGDMEESCIVAPKWYGYGARVLKFQLWLKKCKTY